MRQKILGLGAHTLKSLPEDLCLELLRPEKNPEISAGLTPTNLSLEESKLPRGPQTKEIYLIKIQQI